MWVFAVIRFGNKTNQVYKAKWSIYLSSESLDGLLGAGRVNSFFFFFLAKRSIIVELLVTRYASQHFSMTKITKLKSHYQPKILIRIKDHTLQQSNKSKIWVQFDPLPKSLMNALLSEQSQTKSNRESERNEDQNHNI